MTYAKFIIAGLAGALLSSPAAAADFTFDVPVRLVNLPSLTNARVECFVFNTEVLSPSSTVTLGDATATVPLSGGAFDGIVTVEVNNTSIYPSAGARSYTCNLTASGTARTGAIYGASPGNFRDAYELATGRTIDSLTTVIRANLP